MDFGTYAYVPSPPPLPGAAHRPRCVRSSYVTRPLGGRGVRNITASRGLRPLWADGERRRPHTAYSMNAASTVAPDWHPGRSAVESDRRATSVGGVRAAWGQPSGARMDDRLSHN